MIHTVITLTLSLSQKVLQLDFVVVKAFNNNPFKNGFGVQNHILNLCLVLWIHEGYCVVKSRCEMFILKLSGIQIYFQW